MVIKLIKIGVRALKKLTKIGAIKVTQNRGLSITIEQNRDGCIIIQTDAVKWRQTGNIEQNRGSY